MFLSGSNKNNITLLKGNQNKSIYKKLDDQIYNWIAFIRSLDNLLSTWTIVKELIRRNPNKQNIKHKLFLSWIYKLLERNSLWVRFIWNIGPQFPKNTEDNIF